MSKDDPKRNEPRPVTLESDRLVPQIQLRSYLKDLDGVFGEICEKFPKLYLAAEMLNGNFDHLYTDRLILSDEDNVWECILPDMVFGIYHSWRNSFVLATSGISDVGFMPLRRAIEFVCYISKIKGSDKRARLWIDKSESLVNARKFSNIFGVPHKYFTDKYKHVHNLLVWHDYMSEFSVHGNLASLTKKRQKYQGPRTFSFLDRVDMIPISSGVALLIGQDLLEAILFILKDNIHDLPSYMKQFESTKNQIRLARLESASIEYFGQIPKNMVNAIVTDDRSAIEKNFQQLKSRLSGENDDLNKK